MSNYKLTKDAGDSSERRIVLLGKTGDGRSSTGNTILGGGNFEEGISPSSVTSKSENKTSQVNGRPVTVIDTPGFFDTELSDEEMKREILRCISLSAPGPHAFLLVIKLDRYTEEKKEAMKKVDKLFGVEALRFTIVLFTSGDNLNNKSVQQFIELNSDLKNFVQKCGGGYHVFNNRNRSDCSQVTELLEKIDKMVEKNGGNCYTNEMYELTEQALRQEEERELKK
ncbi:GTPase IMAP family member 4-like, partial [Megalops cyprinoides]|uniref:GTPase IMAP family member 4-like n=1 Tax=Megalops cyprinoides TaxID=118141 RepID=UPI001864AAC6